MAISIPLITTFDAKGINRAITQFKRLDGGVNKSAFVLKNLNQATNNAFRSFARVGAGVALGAGLIGKALVTQAMEAKRVTAETNAIIKATGGSARISAQGVADLSDKLSMQIGVDDELIQKTANLLLTFKQVQNQVGEGNDIFSRAVTTAQDLGSVFGSAESGAMQLGKALSDPIAGITALRRAGINFSAQQKEQIKTLVQSGRTLEAQKLILDEVESQVGGTAKATSTDFGRMQVAVENVAEQLGTLLLPYLETFANFVTTTIVPVLTQFGDIVGKEGLGAGIKFLGGEILTFFTNLEGAGAIVYGIVGAFIALKVAIVAYTVSSGIATVATTAFGLAWNATGIGLVITAIAVLITVVVLMAVKFQWFRDFLKDLWNGIVKFVQGYINIILGVFEFFVNTFIKGVNILIGAFNKLNTLWGGTDIKPLQSVNFELNIMGALIDSNTKKAVIMANAINDHVQGTGRGGSRRSSDYGTSPTGITPPPLPTFTGGGATETVKTMAERFADLTASLQGYGKQLRAVKDAQKAVLQAPKDLAIAVRNTAKAQTHFNNVVNGFGVASKEAKEAVANLAEATRNQTRASNALADAQQAVIRAPKDLAIAISNTAKAQTHFNNTVNGFSASSKEAKEAVANLAEATRNQTRAGIGLADAQKAVLQAPKDLAIAISNTAKAQKHFNNVVNGFSKSSKEAKDATRNLAQAQRDAIRAGIGLADAQQTVIEAQKALTDLQTPASARSVADAQDAITQATYDLADANIELDRAQRRGRPRELALAQIAQRDATNALADAQTNLTDLQANADPQAITDAQETLTQAQLDLAEAKITDKDATNDVTTAQETLAQILEGAKIGTDAYKEALDGLNEAKATEEQASDAVRDSILAEEEAKVALKDANNDVRISERKLKEVVEGAKKGTDAYKEALDGLNEAKATEETASDAVRDSILAEEDAKIALKDANKDVRISERKLKEVLEGAKKGTDAYKDAVDELTEAKRLEADARDAVADSIIAEKDATLELAKAVRALLMSGKGMTAKQIAQAEKLTGVKLGGNKALGGSVRAGRSYVVGEMGREMFTPSTNGMITPNNQLSQGSTIIVNVAGSVTSERKLVEAIRIGLINAQKSGKVLVV